MSQPKIPEYQNLLAAGTTNQGFYFSTAKLCFTFSVFDKSENADVENNSCLSTASCGITEPLGDVKKQNKLSRRSLGRFDKRALCLCFLKEWIFWIQMSYSSLRSMKKCT